LISPVPWVIYTSVYLAVYQSGLAGYITSTTPTVVDILGSLVDGLTRGVTITAIPKTLKTTSTGTANAWTTALLSSIAVSGGGWIVQGMGMHLDQWQLTRPAILDGGVFGTMDFWSGGLMALLYAVLVRSFAQLDGYSNTAHVLLPSGLLSTSTGKTSGSGAISIVEDNIARVVVIATLGTLLASRAVIRRFATTSSSTTQVKAAVNKRIESVEREKEDAVSVVVKSSAKVHPESPRSTPRKKSKQK
jgi:hypothetical protein